MKKGYIILLALLIVAMLASGCTWKKQVEANEVGLVMRDGVSIDEVVGAGRYTEWGWYAAVKVVDVSAKTLSWEDPDLVTNDKQPIGLSVGVTYARDSKADSIKMMWKDYRSEASDDVALENQVRNRIPRVAKAVTTQFTLDEMLGIGEGGESVGRVAVQNAMFELLSAELSEIGCDLLDVGINNIAPSQDYMGLLEDKANAQVQVEVSRQKTLQLQEQIRQEKAQTEIDLEVARRQRLVAEEAAKVYTGNERWYNLQYLERLRDIFGDKDKVWFIDPDADLTLLFTGENVVPVGQ